MRRIASNEYTRPCPKCGRPLKGNAAFASHTRACQRARVVCGMPSGERAHRCQLDAGHVDRCEYHRKGSQGGVVYRWWGANHRPAGYLDDVSLGALRSEVVRLRQLLDAAGVDWRSGTR